MNNVFIVAEIGCNHNGDKKLAKKYLKSNLIPATFPDEIFQFQISYDKNENRWKYLREKIKEKPA